MLYIPDPDRLYVANGSGDRLDILDGNSFAPVKRIAKLADADNVRYDAAAAKVVVGYGKGALQMLDPSSGEAAGEIRLPAHPESFQLERNGSRIFVNVPDARKVAVVDRAKRQVERQVGGTRRSGQFPDDARRSRAAPFRRRSLAGVDAGLRHRQRQGGREGRRSAATPTTSSFDAERKRVYVICGEGRVDIFRQDDADHYSQIGTVTTAARARTGLFVPEEGRLYVAAPAIDKAAARILVYRAR